MTHRTIATAIAWHKVQLVRDHIGHVVCRNLVRSGKIDAGSFTLGEQRGQWTMGEGLVECRHVRTRPLRGRCHCDESNCDDTKCLVHRRLPSIRSVIPPTICIHLAKLAPHVLMLVYMIAGDTSSSNSSLDAFDTARFDASSTERSHAALRAILATHFHVNRKNWNIVTLCRQRISVSADESRVCDLCILDADAPVEQVVHMPPMICVDIISNEPLALIQHRVDIYERMGVKQIWLLDPNFRSAWKASGAGLFQIKNDEMGIPGTSIGFRLNTIFAEMDELLRPGRRTSLSSTVERINNPSTQIGNSTERNRRNDR
jgi:hypothetical protein